MQILVTLLIYIEYGVKEHKDITTIQKKIVMGVNDYNLVHKRKLENEIGKELRELGIDHVTFRIISVEIMGY